MWFGGSREIAPFLIKKSMVLTKREIKNLIAERKWTTIIRYAREGETTISLTMTYVEYKSFYIIARRNNNSNTAFTFDVKYSKGVLTLIKKRRISNGESNEQRMQA